MSSGAPGTISITGAGGFLGRHLVERLLSPGGSPRRLRLLTRTALPGEFTAHPSVTVVRGDLLDPSSLPPLVSPGVTVVNLVHLPSGGREENCTAAANLAEACAQGGARRLIHCSTAVVVGHCRGSHVTETTVCRPVSEYQRTKLAVEEELRRCSAGRYELIVARPAMVFGPGGRNLVKLVRELTAGRPLLRFLKSCVQGRRRMNAVSVHNVAAAIEFLIDAPAVLDGETFLVSDDDDPANNYRSIERRLARRLGAPRLPIPSLPLPGSILRSAARLAGRPAVDPHRIYNGSKLLQAGFQRPVDLKTAIDEFAEWYAGSQRCRLYGDSAR